MVLPPECEATRDGKPRAGQMRREAAGNAFPVGRRPPRSHDREDRGILLMELSSYINAERRVRDLAQSFRIFRVAGQCKVDILPIELAVFLFRIGRWRAAAFFICLPPCRMSFSLPQQGGVISSRAKGNRVIEHPFLVHRSHGTRHSQKGKRGLIFL